MDNGSLPDRGTLGRRRYAIYRCRNCQTYHETEPEKCACDSEQYDMLFLPAKKIYEVLGHKCLSVPVLRSERVEREVTARENGQRIVAATVSSKFKSRCTRCGWRGSRRIGPDDRRSMING